MKTYSKQTNNPLKKIPKHLRTELANYVVTHQASDKALCFVTDNATTYNEKSPRDQVFEFARQANAKLNLPSDIRNYIDKAAASRLRKYGFKRAIDFIEKRCSAAYSALSVLPEAWWSVNTEFKRARLANELAGRARLHLDLSIKKGLSPIDTLTEINNFVGVGLWVPQFSPNASDKEDVIYSILVRVIDDGVWKRAIERSVAAAFENARRAAGMVSPHVSPYASYSACEWLKVRQERQREWLELMAIENETGDLVSMTDVHASSVSNPANRRNELMTRIVGCQEYADSNNHVAVFITMTAPGKYHRLKQRGKYWTENENWNGANPREAHEWLNVSFTRFRSAADRRELTYYGMRVVEPHTDGTPHWHAVFFMPLDQVAPFNELLQFYQFQRDADELYFPNGEPKTKAMKGRFKSEMIDRERGDAVSYIAKYISKNVDGYGLEGLTDLDAKKVQLQETVKNVTAWSRLFSFRQFQFQKTPSVTVWRELRRIEEKQEYCLFEKARRAADMGFFSAFFDYMGGHRLRQSMRPIKTKKEEKENKYGETVKEIVGLIGSGLTVFTHEIKWKLVKAEATKEALPALDLALPWTSGNNCTQTPKQSRSGKIISDFFLKMELDGPTPEWEEFINSG